MNGGESRIVRRENFVLKIPQYFNFLVEDFGYLMTEHQVSQQDNGFILSDNFSYENLAVDRLITLRNAYHPVDYGFELCLYKPSVSKMNKDREMVYFRPKEQQDLDQTYLKEASRCLKDDFCQYITGERWFE